MNNKARRLRWEEQCFLAKCCFTKWEFNLKQHQMILTKNSARKLRGRENKQITSNKHTRHGWFVLPRFGPRRPSPRTLSLSPPITQDRRALLLFKDNSRPRKDHHTLWCLLLAFTSPQNFGGSSMGVKNSTHKWSQDVVLTNSQWFSQGTLARLTWEAFFY